MSLVDQIQKIHEFLLLLRYLIPDALACLKTNYVISLISWKRSPI